MLASALSGRKLLVSKGDYKRPYTDGEVIYIPCDLGEEEDLAVVVQALLISVGSLNPKIIAKLVGRSRISQRYLFLEVMRASLENRNIISCKLFDKINNAFDGLVGNTAAQSFELAAKSGRDFPNIPTWFGIIRVFKLVQNYPSLNATVSNRDILESLQKKDNPRELDEGEDSDKSKIMELIAGPAMNNPLANFFQSLMGAGRSPKSDGGGGGESTVSGMQLGEMGRGARVIKFGIELAENIIGKEPIGAQYPEWDVHQGRYRVNHCAVAECEWQASVPAAISPLKKDRKLERELVRLDLEYQRFRRQRQGEEIDITALVEWTIDRRIGFAGDGHIFETKLRKSCNLGVLILLDATGSTGDHANGQQVFDYQRELVTRLIIGFESIGVRVGAYGFFSRGSSQVRYVHVKGFEERFNEAARRRLAGLEPVGFTRLGAVVRHGVRLLKERAGTPHKLLLVVGDGLPYDHGYEGDYAQVDSRYALKEAASEGVAYACISTQSATDSSVINAVWGAAHCHIDTKEQLPQKIHGLLTEALRSVAA